MFINHEDFQVRRELIKWLKKSVSDVSDNWRGKMKLPATRLKMPIDFLDAVDFTPDINAPISVDAGMKQRLCKNNVFFRGFGNEIQRDVLVNFPIMQNEANLIQNYRVSVANFARWIVNNQMITVKDHQYSMEEWLEHSNYNGARKEQLRKAVGKPRDYYPVKTFIKKEAYPECKPPRTINSRHDAFKALVGPFTHQIEKDVFGSKWTIKGKDLDTQNSIIYERLHHADFYFSMDYSRWESSIGPEVIRQIEMPFFRQYRSPYHWDFHSWLENHLLNNSLVAKGRNSCKIRGVRMSGDMHTSLMNTYINMHLTGYIFSVMGIRWDGFFEGDDGLVGVWGNHNWDHVINNVQLMSRHLGFDLKIISGSQLYKIPFLSRHYLSPTVAVRDPFKALCHAQWSYSLHRHPVKTIVRSRGFGLAYENKGGPILMELGNLFLRFSGAGEMKFDQWWKELYGVPDQTEFIQFHNPVSADVRIKYQELFNITIGQQLEIEEKLRCDDVEGVKEILQPIFNRYRQEWVLNYNFVCSIKLRRYHLDGARI